MESTLNSSTAAEPLSSSIQAEQAPQGEHRPRAYLVNHGSFSPVHRHHVVMMLKAKERLEADGFEVVAGVLGITHAGWIERKGAAAIKDDHRVATIRLACEEEHAQHWLKPDERGVHVGSCWRLDEQYTKAEIQQVWPGAICFCVMGADVVSRWHTSGWRSFDAASGYNLVVVGRAGMMDRATEDQFKSWDGRNRFYYVQTLDGDFSSTRVRQAMEKRDIAELQQLCHESVASYLLAIPREQLFVDQKI